MNTFMLKHSASVGLVAGMLLASLASNASAVDNDGTIVRLADLPANLQQAIQSHVGDGKLDEITKTAEDGDVTYDVDITKKGKERSFSVDDQGNLLEEEVFIGEIPMPVRKAIHGQVGKGSIQDIQKVHEDGEITYDVEMTKDGKTRDFTLSVKGELLELQMFIDELPEKLQAAIKKEAGGAKCGDIYKSIDEDDVLYDVDLETDGKTRTLSFDIDGQLLSEEQDVSLRETPTAVQQSLGGQLAGARLASVTKVKEDGVVTYEAEIVKSGKSLYVVMGADGRILPPDDD